MTQPPRSLGSTKRVIENGVAAREEELEDRPRHRHPLDDQPSRRLPPAGRRARMERRRLPSLARRVTQPATPDLDHERGLDANAPRSAAARRKAHRGGQVSAGAGEFSSGTVSHASVPPLAAAATHAVPPCDFAIVSTIASPSPLPSPPRAASARVKRSKARGRNASGNPSPLSATCSSTSLPRRSARRLISSPP